MIKARNEAGEMVLGFAADRSLRYACPECRESVTPKKGAVMVHHFAHQPRSGCSFGVGESLRHMQMKYQIGRAFAKYDPDYEVPLLSERRADVVIGKVVVECQESALSIPEWTARTRDYNNAGYTVLWLWDVKLVFGKGSDSWDADGLCPYFDLTDKEFRISATIRHCHRHSYGKIYVMDKKGSVLACHLKPAEERTDYWYNSETGDEMERQYTPFTLKVPEFNNPPMRGTVLRGLDGETLVDLGDGVWWRTPRSGRAA